MLLHLLFLVALLGASEGSMCNDCVLTGRTYFVTKGNEVTCEKIATVGRKSIKFSAKTGLECEILESILQLIGGKEEIIINCSPLHYK